MKQLLVTYLLTGLCSGLLGALNPAQIMEKADAVFRNRSSLAVSSMQIQATDGSKRRFRIWGMTLGNRSLTKFADGLVKGMTILSIDSGKEIWVYFRSSGRTRRLSSSARSGGVAGSDFSYDDISNTKYAEQYRCRLDKETGGAWALELTPKKQDNQYSKLRVWIRKKDFVAEKMDFYNQDGVLFKRMWVKDVRKIEGVLTPMRFEMKNLLSGSTTVMRMERITYATRPRKRFFSTSSLNRSLETWKAAYPFFNK